MNRNMSLKRQLWLAFFFMGLLVGIISLSSLFQINRLAQNIQTFSHNSLPSIDGFTKEVSLAVQDVRIISSQFKRIIEEVQNLTPRFEAVSESTSQTAETLGQINEAIRHLNDVAQLLRQEMQSFKLRNSEVIRT